jgi:Ca-activated chloride channel homolog
MLVIGASPGIEGKGDDHMTRAIVGSQGSVPCQSRKGILVGLVGGLLVLAGPLQAGPIFVPGQLEGDKFVPAPVSAPWYHVRYSTAAVTVEEDKANVQIEEVIDGPEKEVQALCLIPLPEGADGSDVRVTVGVPGARPIVLADAAYLAAKKAQDVYEAVARGSGAAKLLAYSGRPAIFVPRVTLQGKVQMTVSFRTPVRGSQGVQSLICPMPASSWTRGPVERLALTVNLRTKDPLRTVFSPTHNATIVRKGLSEATATVRADRWTGLDDFRLFWVADKDDLGLRVLAYRGEGKEDGFFMLLGNPTGAAAKKAVDKDVVFVLDTSGSMRGEKIEQARSAIDYCVEHLNPGDRFNIITFGTAVSSFRNDLVALSPATLAAGREFIENVVANGRTNISGALEKAFMGKAEKGRPRIMIFLTDGAPTVGELIPEKILDQVKKANTNGTKVFVMGVGNDVNAHLLDRLAEITDGSSEYVAPREELDAKIAGLYDRLSHPVLSGVTVSFGELATQSVLPPKLPVLFKGSEIMMVGRYKEGGKHTFTIAGNLSGKPVKYTCEVDLPRGSGGAANEFLAPLWAARQIGYLLQEIRLHGENKELIAEVVRLSQQYGIITEYTAFVAMNGGKQSHDMMYREALGRISAARSEKAGQWAVNQAANDKALQQRVAASPEANSYRDRRGNLTTTRNVTQLGRRAFYLQDGQWVDAEEAGTRKQRVVKLFSPEYVELLKTDPTFAKAQQLGWALSINVGDERIVIEKDGKQKDESLKVKPQEIEQDPNLQQIPNLQIPNKRGLNQDLKQQIPFPNKRGPNQQQQQNQKE